MSHSFPVDIIHSIVSEDIAPTTTEAAPPPPAPHTVINSTVINIFHPPRAPRKGRTNA